MALKNYSGPGLGNTPGWQCPTCGNQNAIPMGNPCQHCGEPKEKADAPPEMPKRTLAADVTPPGEMEASPLGGVGAEQERVQLTRRYKVIEYFGPPGWVETAISRSLFGAKPIGQHAYLIGTEIPGSVLLGQTEILGAVTEARAQEPVWEAELWASGTPVPPIAPPATDPTISTVVAAFGEAMTTDQRYAQTIADALEAFYLGGGAEERHLPKEEADNIIQVLRTILTQTETQKEPVSA